MNDKIENPPAFPHNEVVHQSWGRENHFQAGMTLRDYFAEAALKALIGENGDLLAQIQQGEVTEIVASASYKYADAMLKERLK